MGRQNADRSAHRTPRELSDRAARLLTLDAEPWLSCDDCFDQVDSEVEQLVLHRTAVAPPFRAHLLGCPACQEEARTLAVLVAEDAGLDVDEALRRLEAQLA